MTSGRSIEGNHVDDAGAPAPHGFRGKVLRYAAGSVIATVCSYVAFLLVYGPLNAGPGIASTVGWLAGAIPNYWLNRSWTWQRRGRPDLLRELLPYIVIIALTVGLAVAATTAVEAGLDGFDLSDTWRLILVSGTFLAVYAVVFLFRFLLLDRLFAAAQTHQKHPTDPTPGTARTPDEEPM